MDTNFQPDNNKPLLKIIGALLAVFLGLLVIQKASDLYKTFSSSRVPENTISMSAEGKVTAVPDLASVTVGVLTTGSTAKAATDENNRSIARITEAIKKLGIDAKDMVTSNLSVYPTYTYTGGKNEINGYQANQNLTIKVHGVDKSTDLLNKVLDASVTEGSNQIQGVTLGFDDPDNLRQQARSLALQKAKQKAEELAKEAGLRLGKIVSISESTGSGYPVPYMVEGRGMGGGGAESAANIQTGTQDITETMTVVFEVK